ncbi:PREDICTED: leucine zipper protein 2-like [Lipotes vexillifer]|uniref:Leucine zipper protein 2-like n=1 Tax=Lipotes vexillifer TaxID=118797 RepID=A0A340WLN0_LIPVE|nr:PREDICTED: leucine zipper protein 2-like [Lipotes vexillifer]
MKFSPAHYLLPLLPALVLSTRQDSGELEKQLKQVLKERSTILRQLTKTSRELDGIKVNLQNLKNDEKSAKTDVQKLLEIGQKQREQMKSLQEALEIQLKETTEKAEKQQATIAFLKTEMERKNKMIRDLQNEAQQLTDLERKLAVAKNELEKAALDRASQLKAMKETVQLCLSTVFHDQPPPPLNLFKPSPTRISIPSMPNDTKVADARTRSKAQQTTSEAHESSQVETTKEEYLSTPECDTQIGSTTCSMKHKENPASNDTAESEPVPQNVPVPPCTECEEEKNPGKQLTSTEGKANREKK